MRKSKFALAVVTVLSLLALFAVPASAADAQLLVIVGDASVQPGLCFPGVNCGGVGANGDAAFAFNAPSSVTLPGVGTVKGLCATAGTLGVGVAQDPGGSCELSSNGRVYELQDLGAPLAPSCGNSSGQGQATLRVNGTGYTEDIGWISSAGGTLPITAGGSPGTVAANAASGDVVAGLVQARPLGADLATQSIPCLTTPATTFTVVGVIALANA